MLVALKTFSCTMLFLFTISRFRSQEGHTWCGGRSEGFDLRILSPWLDNHRSRSEGEKGRPRLVVMKDAVFFQ